MPQGGAFTTGLIKALKAAKGNLNYTDLFLKARSAVLTMRDNQTPQFDTVQNFDPYTRFLEGSPTGERDLYEVIKTVATGMSNVVQYMDCQLSHQHLSNLISIQHLLKGYLRVLPKSNL